MAMNRSLIGKKYGPVDGVVDVREAMYYALATNDTNEWYIDGARPGGTVAPPLYAISKDLGGQGDHGDHRGYATWGSTSPSWCTASSTSSGTSR